jgi:ABC-2 type transport system permease protein
MRRLRALMRKELTHMRRDPRTVVMIFIMPLLQLLLLGYAANTDVRNVSTAVFDQDNSRESRALLAAYKATGYFMLDHVAYSETEATRMITGGQVRVAIMIPPRYGSDLSAGRTVPVAVLIDGSDPTIASTALSTATLTGQAHATAIRTEQLAARAPVQAASLPVEVRARVLYNPDLRSSYNLVPGLIATILMMTTTVLTSSSIVKEREQGTIEQLIVTPIRNWELVVAKITPYVLVSLANVVLILLVGILWFRVPIRGSFVLLFALTGLYLLPNLGIGLFVSTFARTQQQAQFMVMPIMMPSMMLSGFFFPVAALPPVLRVISSMLPLTHFLIIVRSVMVKGAGLELLTAPVLALAIFAVLLVGLAALRFRKTLD